MAWVTVRGRRVPILKQITTGTVAPAGRLVAQDLVGAPPRKKRKRKRRLACEADTVDTGKRKGQ